LPIFLQRFPNIELEIAVDDHFAPGCHGKRDHTSVSDRGGALITGLTATDFRVFDNGKEQKITEDLASHPISMVIAVQANAQVEKILPQIQKLGSAIQAQVLGDEGEVAVLEFDHRIQTLTDFTSDPDLISKTLKKLKPAAVRAA